MEYVVIALVSLGWLIYFLRNRLQARLVRNFAQSLNQRRICLDSEESSKKPPMLSQMCMDYNALMRDYQVMKNIANSETNRIEMLLKQLQEAVLLIDSGGNIVSCNHAAETVFNIPSTRSEKSQSIYPYIKSTEFLDYMTHIQQGGPETQREFGFERDGKTIWFEVSGSSLPYQVIRGGEVDERSTRIYLFVMHDITRLKDLENIRREFVANVSHELRTPVTIIKGFTDTLLNDHRTLPAEDREKFLLKIHRNVARFHLLLEDLLQLSKLEGDRISLNRREIPVRTILDDASEYARPRLADDQRVDIIVAADVTSVWVDELKFGQIVNNLVDNAVKHAKGMTALTISAERIDDMLWFNFSDDGQGIPEKDLPHLFERFYRVDKGRSRENGGTGLGLSIVKHIVMMHGGDVQISSTPSKGTTIRFALPARNN